MSRRRASIFGDIEASNLLESAFLGSPAYHHKLDESNATVERLCRSRVDLIEYVEEYSALQKQSSAVLRQIASLLVQPEFVDPAECSGGDPITRQALACCKELIKFATCHSTLASVMTWTPPEDPPEREALAKVKRARLAYQNDQQAEQISTEEFAALSKKKTSDRARFDSAAALQVLRQAAHKTSLAYATELLLIPKTIQMAMLAPAERLLQQLCEFVPYTTAICGVDDAARTDYLGSLTAGRLGAIDEMEQSGPTRRTTFEKRIPLLADLDENLYLRNPDPMLEENAVESEPKEALLQEVQTKTKTSAAKHGYLHVRGLGLKKQVGPGEKGKKERWSRAFFVIFDYALLIWHDKQWMIVSRLTGASASIVNMDRAFVFQVQFPGGKLKLRFQAESRSEMESWSSTVNEVGRDLAGAMGVHAHHEGKAAAPVFYSVNVPKRQLVDDRLKTLNDSDQNASWVPDSGGNLHLVLVKGDDEAKDAAAATHSDDDDDDYGSDGSDGYDVGALDGDYDFRAEVAAADTKAKSLAPRNNPFGGSGGVDVNDPLFDDDDDDLALGEAKA